MGAIKRNYSIKYKTGNPVLKMPRSHAHAWGALLALLLLSLSCGGNGGGGGVVTIPPAMFTTSGTPTTIDQVRLIGSAIDDDVIQVSAVIHGQTTSTDIYSFAFDVVLSNTAAARYVPGSATAGDALSLAAGQGLSVMVSQQGDRVVVGVTKTGGGTGNQVSDGDHVIASLNFRVMDSGATALTFAGSPANPHNPTANPAALDSNGSVIASVTFDAGSARLSR